MEVCSEEAVKYVWEGAIPLQIHLHESEVTTLPPPPPVLVSRPALPFFTNPSLSSPMTPFFAFLGFHATQFFKRWDSLDFLMWSNLCFCVIVVGICIGVVEVLESIAASIGGKSVVGFRVDELEAGRLTRSGRHLGIVSVLGSRIGYLPLLIPLIKPHFNSTLPPGADSLWFDYKGLPLKWYIPTGVLFDLLCIEPERPWNLTVHFRGHPGEVLTPCEGEDSVKWSYINSLKEAAYIINGNCKNVMNMSQADQFELWQSLVKGNMDSYIRISSRLKLGPVGENCIRTASSLPQPRQAVGDSDFPGSSRPCRIPVRLYIRHIGEDLDDLEDAPMIDSWDTISYVNRPVEIHKEEGDCLTLRRAMEALLPELFDDGSLIDDHDIKGGCQEADLGLGETDTVNMVRSAQVEETPCPTPEAQPSRRTKVKLIRIQGIELDLDIPFFWVVNNLKNPEYFLHICVFVVTSLNQSSAR